jgi:hypothetical protein
VGFITDERFQLLMMPIVDQVKKFLDWNKWIMLDVFLFCSWKI